jgi:hypothetical protein
MVLGRSASAVILFLTVSLASSAQTYIFGRADFPVGNSPNAIVTGDFNGDGVIDVAVTNSSDNTISILMGRPNARIAPQVTYPTGPVPVAIVGEILMVTAILTWPPPTRIARRSTKASPHSAVPQPSVYSFGNGDGTFQRCLLGGDTACIHRHNGL